MRFLWALFFLTASAIAQTGTGFTGQYFDNSDFTTLKTTRTDATVNFNWGTAIPSGTAITNADNFSVAWSGQIDPQFAELYTFFVTADDGARLWVDDQLLVGRTFFQGTGEMRGQVRLKAGQRVNIRLEFIELTGNASVKLEWASASQARQVIPTARLYTTTAVTNGGCVMREVWTGIAGASIASLTSNANYPNKPASREFLTSFECLALNWEDSYGTRVTGFIRPEVTGSYTFAVSGDDAVQLYLSTDSTAANKALIASVTVPTAFRQWNAQASQQSTVRTLTAGKAYYVELLHKEDTGTDHWSVGWMKPGDSAFSVVPGSVLMQPGVDTVQPASSANFFDTLATEQPRLGVTRERFLWLKQQYQSATPSNAKTRAQAVITAANGDLTAALQIQRGAQDIIERLATAWWLTGDSQYAEAAWLQINNSINNGDWTDPWKGVEDGVVAIGYDWLYPYWSQARKDAMTNCMVTKGFSTGWTDSYNNNIGVIINAGHLMAILAVGTVNESAAEGKLGSAIGRLSTKIDKWNANAGAWYEGTNYGILTKWDFGQAMPAMETALGSTWTLSKVAGVSATASEPLTIADNLRNRFTYADVGTGSEAAIGWANWFARRFNALEVLDYSRQIGTSALNALMLPETTLSPAAAGLMPDTAFRGPADSSGGSSYFQEVVTLRENWTDTKATFVGAKGGGYGASSHTMLDGGTFRIMARGQRWFIDLSSESYSVPNHNTTTVNPNGRDRWDYYRNRAEAHNTIVINPDAGPDRTIDNKATLLNFQSAPSGQRSFAVWDLAPTMLTPVTKVQRGIQLLGNRHQVLVQDEIVTPSASTVWWFAHYSIPSTSATVSGDGSSVMMQIGTERLWGKIVSGGGVFTTMAAAPLPTSPNPAENTPNTNANKLAIKLTGVTNTTLAVWFVPLAPGENPPATLPTITPLNTWNLATANDAPVAQNGTGSSVSNLPADVDLSTLVSDDWTYPANMIFAVSNPVGGTVTLLADGHTARFTLTPGFNGVAGFSFTARDEGALVSNTATVTVGVPAVTSVWTSTTDGTWSTGAKWNPATPPVSGRGNNVQFFAGQTLGAIAVNATNDIAGTMTMNALTFGGTGATTTVVNLTGSPFQIVNNGATLPVVTLDGTTTGFTYNIANNITLGADTTFNAAHTGKFIFSGVLDGPGGLTRTNTFSTLILAGDNTFSGDVTIAAGTLQIGNDGATGSLGGGDVIDNGQLRFDRTGTVAVPNNISGTGTLYIDCPINAGTIVLTGANDFSGNVTVNSGTLRIASSSALGVGTKTVSMNNGNNPQLRLDGSAAPIDLADTITFYTSNDTAGGGAIISEAGDNIIEGNITLTGGAGSTRILSLAGTITLAGNIAPNTTGRAFRIGGAGNGIVNGTIANGSTTNVLSVQKIDAGTWTLSAANTFSATMTISAGTLVLGNPDALGNGGSTFGSGNGSTTLTSGATLDLGGQQGVNEVIALGGTGVGGNGALINSSATPSSIAGGVISSISTTAGGAHSAVPDVTITGGGGTGATATATLGVSAASFTINGGTTVYSTAPGTTISGGGGTGATATAVLTGGVVSGITMTAAGTGYTTAPTVTFSGGTVTTAGTNPTGTGNATNFIVSGITVTNPGSGYTSVPSVTFSTGTGTAATANRSAVSLGAATSIGGSGDIVLNPGITGSNNTLTKVGTGTLTLNGTNTFTGATTVNAGTLQLNGSLTSSVAVLGTFIHPGSVTGNVTIFSGGLDAPDVAPSLRPITGSYSLASGATLRVLLAGTAAGTQYDQLPVNGTVTLGGALDVVVGANLAPGSTFTILNKAGTATTATTFAGKAENSTFVTTDGYTFRINYNAGTGNDIVLTLLTTPIEQWRFANFGSILNIGAGLDTADGDGDGTSNLIEYATKMNPNASDSVPQAVVKKGSMLEFTYTKNKAATDVTFTVEWSDTLASGTWSTTGVSAPVILSDNGVTQQVKVTVAAGSVVAQRFMRLKVTR